jgi:hypothetical protein
MMTARCAMALGSTALMMTLLVPVAGHAQEGEAEQLFRDGRSLMDAGDHARACPLLERAFALSKGMGAQYQLAECYVATARIASAHRHFLEIADVAQRVGQSERASKAGERARAIEPRLSRLAIDLSSAPPSVSVSIDGVPADAEAIERGVAVDPGVYVVEASAPGHHPWRVTTKVEGEGATARLELPALEPTLVADMLPPETGGEHADGSNALLIAGVAIGAVGFVGLGVGIALGPVASSKYDESDAHCEGGCTPEGLAIVEDARTIGNIGTGVFIGGAVLTAVGVTMFVLGLASDEGDSADVTVVPWLSPSAAGAGIAGRF